MLLGGVVASADGCSGKMQFHQSIQGGSSKKWALTMTMKGDKNPAGLNWSYASTYYCGVSISGGTDHTLR